MTSTINTELLRYATDSKTNAIDVQMTQWSQFQDVDNVLKSNGEEWFYELRDVLKKHNALNRFGITLLHKHFDVADDEIMLETTDVENKTLHMRPVKTKDYIEKENAPLAATSIRLVDGDNVAMQTYMWSQLRNANDISRISDSDVECLRELRDVLKKYNALDRFGIKLFYKQFEITEDEMLFETTDVQERTQIIRPVNVKYCQDREDMQAMITLWKMVEDEPVVRLICACGTGYDGNHNGY